MEGLALVGQEQGLVPLPSVCSQAEGLSLLAEGVAQLAEGVALLAGRNLKTFLVAAALGSLSMVQKQPLLLQTIH